MKKNKWKTGAKIYFKIKKKVKFFIFYLFNKKLKLIKN